MWRATRRGRAGCTPDEARLGRQLARQKPPCQVARVLGGSGDPTETAHLRGMAVHPRSSRRNQLLVPSQLVTDALVMALRAPPNQIGVDALVMVVDAQKQLWLE